MWTVTTVCLYKFLVYNEDTLRYVKIYVKKNEKKGRLKIHVDDPWTAKN